MPITLYARDMYYVKNDAMRRECFKAERKAADKTVQKTSNNSNNSNALDDDSEESASQEMVYLFLLSTKSIK